MTPAAVPSRSPAPRAAFWPRGAAAALAAVLLSACVSTDPRGAFDGTAERVAGRHPGEAVWLDDEAARAAAAERARQLLAEPLTPDAVAELALLGNPGLQAELRELGIAQADLAQATRLANPGLHFSRLTGSGVTQTTTSLTASLVDWLVLPLRRRLAEAELERVQLAAGDALLAAIAEARLALVGYQAALARVERLERIEALDRAAADYADALLAAGNLTALERASFAAEWAETRAELGRARVEAVRRREAVARAAGLDGGDGWTAAAGPPPPGDVADAAVLEETAVAERLDLAAARWAVTALERALAVNRKTRLAPVGVDVGVERERETGEPALTGPTLELRLPLFDTGKASVARLEAELERARWQLAAREAVVRSGVREKAAELAASRELADLYEESILPLRREVVERSLAEYNQMLIGTFDLLRARSAEFAAESRAAEARASYWEAWIELERAVGTPLPASARRAPAADPVPAAAPPAAAEPPPAHQHHHGGPDASHPSSGAQPADPDPDPDPGPDPDADDPPPAVPDGGRKDDR